MMVPFLKIRFLLIYIESNGVLQPFFEAPIFNTLIIYFVSKQIKVFFPYVFNLFCSLMTCPYVSTLSCWASWKRWDSYHFLTSFYTSPAFLEILPMLSFNIVLHSFSAVVFPFSLSPLFTCFSSISIKIYFLLTALIVLSFRLFLHMFCWLINHIFFMHLQPPPQTTPLIFSIFLYSFSFIFRLHYYLLKFFPSILILLLSFSLYSLNCIARFPCHHSKISNDLHP